jgi:hypothetical protein
MTARANIVAMAVFVEWTSGLMPADLITSETSEVLHVI